MDVVVNSLSAEAGVDAAVNVHERTPTACMTTVVVFGSNSSEHSLITDPTSSAILDKASSLLFFPGLYFMLKWKSANSATHLEAAALSFAVAVDRICEQIVL